MYSDDIEYIRKQFVIHLLDSRRNNATSYRLAPYDDRCKQVGLKRLGWRRKVADAVLGYDIYVRNINDDLISSRFVRNDSEYDLRRSTMKLLVEPRLHRGYLLNQPIVRLIRLINDFKDVVIGSRNRNDFKIKMIEAVASSR